MQQPAGIFEGDVFVETDTCFLYCAVSALKWFNRLDHHRTVSHFASCPNF
jgi:prenyltransferase beta subunit